VTALVAKREGSTSDGMCGTKSEVDGGGGRKAREDDKPLLRLFFFSFLFFFYSSAEKRGWFWKRDAMYVCFEGWRFVYCVLLMMLYCGLGASGQRRAARGDEGEWLIYSVGANGMVKGLRQSACVASLIT